MADSVATINKLAEDPDFLKLSDPEQKSILLKAKGQTTPSPSVSQPKVAVSRPAGVSMMGPSDQYKGVSDEAIDFARPFAADVAGGAAATLAAPTAPFTGGAGPVAVYGGAYSVVDGLLNYLKQNGAKSPADALKEGVVNAGIQKLVGGLIGKIGESTKGFLNADQPEIMKLAPTTSQALGSERFSNLGSQGFTKLGSFPRLGNFIKSIEDMNVTAKNAALDRTAGKGFSEALELLKRNNLNISNTSGPDLMNPNMLLNKANQYGQSGLSSLKIIDDVIKDPNKLEATLTRSQSVGTGENLKKTLAQYQFSKIFNDATLLSNEVNQSFGSVKRLDPQALANVWLDPAMQDSYKKLYSSQQRADISQFFKNIEQTQDKLNPVTYKKLWLMGGGVGLASSIISGTPIIGGIGGVTSVYLGAKALGSLLTKPTTARLIVNMAGGAPLNASEQYAGKMITSALMGSTIGLVHSDGSVTQAEVTKDGIQPLNK